MIFASIEFLFFFLPIFMVFYGIMPKAYKNAALLAGSLIFYAYGEPRYLLLLMASVAVNYFIGLHIPHKKIEGNKRRRRRKALFIAAIIGNVGVLVFLKMTTNETGLPLGVSFYTFQVMSFLIDVYRGDVGREQSFISLAAYIVMFPRLTAGPIVRYGEVAGHLAKRERTPEGVQDGIKVFIAGLTAKVLLADRIGILWNEVQITGFESISTPLAWMGAFAYSMKIYFDFYGYSLMAVGLGRMLGFELPQNFRTPYMAGSVRDFYRRWHITLGRWFCRYVYVPLGGSRGDGLRTALNLLVIWMLTGIWHGSTPNYLLWGLFLCILIIVERQAEKIWPGQNMKILPHLYLWVVIPVSWMFFAIMDISQIQVYLGRMFGLVAGINVNVSDWQKALANYGWLFLISFAACTPLVEKIYRKMKRHIVGMLLLGALFWICVWRIIVEGNNTFMYFGF